MIPANAIRMSRITITIAVPGRIGSDRIGVLMKADLEKCRGPQSMGASAT